MASVDRQWRLRERNTVAPRIPIAIRIPAATNGPASDVGVTPFPMGEGVITGCVGRLAVATGETDAVGGGAGLVVGLEVNPPGELGVGVGAEVCGGVGRGGGAGVGRGVRAGVGRGVGEAAAATTVIVPFIPESAWISQTYE